MNKNNGFDIDNKIKAIFNEEIEVPDIVNVKSKEAYDMLREIHNDKLQKNKMRSLKVVASVALISTLTITTTFAVEYIIDYFNQNKQSLYLSDKNDFEKTSNNINLTVKDKGIEFTIDNISIDDNYITVFHTSKIDKNINKIDKDAYLDNPIISTYMDGERIEESSGIIEHEATYISENELKGMQKIDVSSVNIDNNDEIVFRVNNIFCIEGNWEISLKVDKLKSVNNNYNVNKDYTINQTYDYNNEKIDIKHNINVEKVTISPLANTIRINEKPTKVFKDWTPMLGNSFALFDDKNNSLDVLDKGGSGVNTKTGIASNSYEFLKADKDTKSLTLVPISFDNSIENKELEPQSIGNLPIVFETSEYGKVVIEDIKITDTEIKYTYYKDGVVPGYLTLWFYDEEGDEIDISSSVKESLDRHTGRYTTILKLEGYENDISKIRKIKKVSTFSHSDMKLLYDQQIKIDLKE